MCLNPQAGIILVGIVIAAGSQVITILLVFSQQVDTGEILAFCQNLFVLFGLDGLFQYGRFRPCFQGLFDLGI